MTAAEEIKALEAKLAARKNQPGFAANIREIEARIAELKKGGS